MKKVLIYFLLLNLFLIILSKNCYAVENPTAVNNNKVGIHILFPEEIKEAAKLVNSNGGDWGYVTIPIQAGDKNLKKWQKFMDDAKIYHIIPIIRLASEGDYFNTKVWRKPTSNDVLDFANFLNSLDWPVKNRYITVFNEVNRGDEWGGIPNPNEYADILSYAANVFKTKNENFFIISAGLDNASSNVEGKYVNQYDFLRRMNLSIPGIFSKIDGLGSHSYPNPAFSQPPTILNSKSIASFKFERDLVESLSSKKLPVFIMETGWSKEFVSNEKIASYLKIAFSDVWNDEGIIAVTPFLLRAYTKPFNNFSFIESETSTIPQYKTIENLIKTKGKPILSPISTKSANVLGENVKENQKLPFRNFSKREFKPSFNPEDKIFKSFLSWFLKI